MPVVDLVRALPFMGRIRATNVLRRVPVSAGRSIGSMTLREREMLVCLLADTRPGQRP